MKKKEIIIFCISAHATTKTFNALVDQYKLYPVDMVFTPDYFFWMKIVLKVIAINDRGDQ